MQTRIVRFVLASLLVVIFFSILPVVASAYDPLESSVTAESPTLYYDITDATRKREIPLKVYLPASVSAAPVILFSHGLGGDREAAAYLGNHWSHRGYVVVVLQHAGSDAEIWKNQPLRERMNAMRDAAAPENLLLRIKDVSVVLDELTKWNKDANHSLTGRLDLDHVGMSGHSFGALTTQSVAGQSAGWRGKSAFDERIKAAVILSPSAPRIGKPEAAFANVAIPWMLMTGTKDTSPIGNATVESRLAVFPALPSGDKYELVLYNAEHSAFGDRGLLRDKQSRNPNHHRLIIALSTSFWDAYLRDDAAAKAWLTGDAARTLLEPQDRFQMK